MDYKDADYLVSLHNRVKYNSDLLTDLDKFVLCNLLEDVVEYDKFNGVGYYEEKSKEKRNKNE